MNAIRKKLALSVYSICSFFGKINFFNVLLCISKFSILAYIGFALGSICYCGSLSQDAQHLDMWTSTSKLACGPLVYVFTLTNVFACLFFFLDTVIHCICFNQILQA